MNPRILLSLAVIFTVICLFSSCSSSKKTGCPTSGGSMGAERVLQTLDGGGKLPKAKKFKY